MSIGTAIVFSMLLLTVTGCATVSDPSATKQEKLENKSTVKPAKHDEKKSMNEESQEAVR